MTLPPFLLRAPDAGRRARNDRQDTRPRDARGARLGRDRRDRSLHRRVRSRVSRGPRSDEAQRAALRSAGHRLRLPELRDPLSGQRGDRVRGLARRRPDPRAGAVRGRAADAPPSRARQREARRRLRGDGPVPRPRQSHARARHHADAQPARSDRERPPHRRPAPAAARRRLEPPHRHQRRRPPRVALLSIAKRGGVGGGHWRPRPARGREVLVARNLRWRAEGMRLAASQAHDAPVVS